MVKRKIGKKSKRSDDPFKSSFKKRRVTRARKVKKKAPPRRRGPTKKKVLSRKKLVKDPRPRGGGKKVSKNAVAEPTTVEAITKKYQPPAPSEKQIVLKKKQKAKHFWDKSKDVASTIGKGIEATAKFAGRTSKMIEPYLDAMALSNPEMMPFAAVNTGVADVTRFIEGTAKAAAEGKDRGKEGLTDTGKYQKMIKASEEAPKVDFIREVDPRYLPPAPYPPMPARMMDID